MKMKVNAEKIKRWRDERCWSQEHFADVSGVSLRTIQRVEKGEACSRDTVMAMAAALNLDASALTIDVDEFAKKAVSRKSEELRFMFLLVFKIHLASFIFGIALLAIINFADGSSHLWFLEIATWWGLGVIAHGFTYIIIHLITKAQTDMNSY